MICQDSRVERGVDHTVDVRAVRIAGDHRRQVLCAGCRAHYTAVWHFDWIPAAAPDPAPSRPAWLRNVKGKDFTGRLIA